MSFTQHREGKYILNSLTLVSGSRSLDISKIVALADIYESILSPTPVIVMNIIDGQGLLSGFILTEAKVRISFTTYEESNPVDYTFVIISASVSENVEARNKLIVLTGVSEETAKSKTMIEPITIKKIESSNIVKAYLDKLDTKKPYFFERTRGLYSYDMSNVTPFEAIDIVRHSAMSSEYNGHAFVFFENKNGYHFKSIEKLIDEGLKSVGDKMYIHSPVAKSSPESNSSRNILAYKVMPTHSAYVSAMIGGFFNKVKMVDLKTGEATLYETKAKNLTFKSLNNGSFTFSAEEIEKYGGKEAKIELRMYNPDTENHQYGEKLNQLPYFMSGFLNTILTMTTFGDSTVTIGDVIACKIPKNTGLTVGASDDDLILSGNYLVCKCRHTLNFNENAEYLQSFELIKDGVAGEAIEVR